MAYKSLKEPPEGVTLDYSITKDGFFKHTLTEEEKKKLKNKTAQLLANLRPEDYRGETPSKEIQDKLDFVRDVRKKTKNQKDKFKEI